MIEATTLLAENTGPILRDMTAHLSRALGADVHFDESMPHADRRRAVEAGQVGIVWACGLLTAELIAGGRLDAIVVGAPIFEGETAPVYHSVLIARDGDIESIEHAHGKRVAVNERESWSGNHGLAAHLAGLGLSMNMFVDVVFTGSHRGSIGAVRDGRADIAAIDNTVWNDFLRLDNLTTDARAGIAVIGRTADWPAPPFSLLASLDPDDRTRLAGALTSIQPRQIAGLNGIEATTLTAYQALRRST